MLVVDDKKLNLDIIKRYLIEVGYDTVCVTSGSGTLRLIETDPLQFSVVLLRPNFPLRQGLAIRCL
ncbi:hypothetical protein [Desulfitispora alkaliphila]|uniref:hypothetical protein n=1 Tax=Desulfitispora alkaliphila TaxID=622674 RepID=UPI003D1D79EA